MTVTVRLFADLVEYLPPGATGKRAKTELPDGATVLTLIDTLGIPFEISEGIIGIAINDEVSHHEAPLKDGDVVSLFPALAGG